MRVALTTIDSQSSRRASATGRARTSLRLPGSVRHRHRATILPIARNERRSRMADTYRNFAALARKERSGIDYDVLVRRARTAFAIVAPHGGGIEAGMSELADAVAGATHSFYTF